MDSTLTEKKKRFVGTVPKQFLSETAVWGVFGAFATYEIPICLGLVLFDCLLLFVCLFMLQGHTVHWHRRPREAVEFPLWRSPRAAWTWAWAPALGGSAGVAEVGAEGSKGLCQH